jgi:hypothetical protein
MSQGVSVIRPVAFFVGCLAYCHDLFDHESIVAAGILPAKMPAVGGAGEGDRLLLPPDYLLTAAQRRSSFLDG